MARRLCFSIGVSAVLPRNANSESGFAILDGATVAAKCIGDWAVAAGFPSENVAVVTDERAAGAVTTARLREAVAKLFPTGADTVEHLVLSFCGHGLTGAEVGSTFWLLSDALQEQYRVNVDLFVGELLKFGVQRITLISDACRDGPPTLDLQRLDGSRVINGPGSAVKSPQFDRLAACQDGSTAFMVGDKGSARPGKCIFSGVVADILWKREVAAISDGAITTLGLGAIARSRATERAREYRLELYPQCLVDPLPAVLVSADQDLPPEQQPQAWPKVGEGQTMGHVELDHIDLAEALTPKVALDRITKERGFRDNILGAGFGADVADLDFSRNFSGFPKHAAGPLFDLIKLRKVSRAGDSDDSTRAMARYRAEHAVKHLEAIAATRARQRVARQFRKTNALVRLGRDLPDANLISLKVGILAIYADKGTTVGMPAHVQDDLILWQVDTRRLSGTVIVETRDGYLVPVTLYRDLVATISPDPRSGYVIAYGSQSDPGSIERAFKSIADLASGTLTSSDLERLAVELRNGKHVDPLKGVIAAYLYKAVADVDSIRRMAYFYQQHGQAVPFDIALLGDMPVSRAPDGQLVVHVPQVPRRAVTDRSLPKWVTQATRAVDVTVGGIMPWLAVGWDYVADPASYWQALVDRLAPFSHDVMRSGFTNLPAGAGPNLIERLQLQPVPIPS